MSSLETETGIDVTIGIVTSGNMRAMTCYSLLAVKGNAIVDFSLGIYVQHNRNVIAGRCKTKYLLFVDSDIIFPPESIGKLRDALEADPGIGAVSGVAMYWDGSGRPIHNWRNGKAYLNDKEVLRRTADFMEQGLVAEADKIGTGFLMISRECLEKLEPPWFQTPYVNGRDEGYDSDKPCMLGEDLFFIQKAKAAGFRPSVHFGCPVAHEHYSVWHPGMITEYFKKQRGSEQKKSQDRASVS